MSFDRVIQDSDDEDDPLLEERPPRAHPPPVIHQSDVRASYRDTSNDPLNEESSHQIAVNFDQFLASQEGGQAGPTSSQQQREERWIPATAGGGSIGTMMTEIGLAQQRLFDDDTQHESARLGPLDGYGSNEFDTMNEYNDEYIAPQQPEIHIQSTVPSGSYISLPPPDIPDNGYMGPPDDYHQYAPTSTSHASLTSYDQTQSATSYNIFESSLRPSESTYSENNTTLKSHQTIPTEAVQRSPRRWNSTQGTISSPHDTELNSSILAAAKASRSRSDNNPSSNEPLHLPANADEIPHPADAEVPVVGKKRGRPKKQSLPDVDRDDELPQPAGNETVEQPPASEKRKPGRPPKSAKTSEANESAARQPEDAPTIPKDPASNELADKTITTVTETFQFQVPAHPHERENKPASPPKTKKASKEPAKKKLKRGKTTSVTLQKTYESDVEDDVIWVESRPSNAAAPEDANAAPFSINIEAPTAQKTIEPNQPDTIPPDQATTTSDQAPKKRGRKRKKTSEQAPTDQQQPLDTPNQLDPTKPEAQRPSKETTPIPPPSPKPEESHSPQPSSPTTTKQPRTETPITPQKHDPKTPNNASASTSASRGPTKHSPISSTSKVPYRVGLSRRARIAPLLKIVKR